MTAAEPAPAEERVEEADLGGVDGSAAAALPGPVRQRVVALAAQVLGGLPADQVPVALRRVARFAPARRAKLGEREILAVLGTSAAFRSQVAAGLDDERREGGEPVGPVEPVERAVRSFLVRPDGWQQDVEAVRATLAEEEERVDLRRAREQAAQAQEQLRAARTEAREERDRLRGEVERAKRDATTLRRAVAEAREAQRAAGAAADRDVAAAREAAERADQARATVEAENRRLRGRLAEAEAALEALRRAEREGRSLASTRLRLLLDAVTDAAAGLRRELALPPVTTRPGDLAGGLPPSPPGGSDGRPESTRALAADDPRVLDELLAMPQVHLVVDGYNVSKATSDALPLEAQRTQLVRGLAALVARTGAETTVVFDGADLGPTPPVVATPRGVRIRFSPPGVSADEVIRQLVRAEPEGRPVVVVSSDREVADGVRRAGVRPVPAQALVQLLAR